MARMESDSSILLSAMAGPDARAPASINEPGNLFSGSLKKSFKKTRIAWSRDLGGLPMDPRVGAVLESQRKVFSSLGCIIEEAQPDFSGATEAFEVLLALCFFHKVRPLLKDHRNN